MVYFKPQMHNKYGVHKYGVLKPQMHNALNQNTVYIKLRLHCILEDEYMLHETVNEFPIATLHKDLSEYIFVKSLCETGK